MLQNADRMSLRLKSDRYYKLRQRENQKLYLDGLEKALKDKVKQITKVQDKNRQRLINQGKLLVDQSDPSLKVDMAVQIDGDSIHEGEDSRIPSKL